MVQLPQSDGECYQPKGQRSKGHVPKCELALHQQEFCSHLAN